MHTRYVYEDVLSVTQRKYFHLHFLIKHGHEGSWVTDYNRCSIGTVVVVARTQCQVEAFREGSCTVGVEGHHIIGIQESHRARDEIAKHPNPIELFCEWKLMGNPAVPGCVLSIIKLHAPGLIPSAQPAVLRGSLARDGGICDPQLPVGLASHVHLPVVATTAVRL